MSIFLIKKKSPPHHMAMMHFAPDEFEHFYWLSEIGLYETADILYNDGTILRSNYFKHYGIT